MSLFKDFGKNIGGIVKDAALNGVVQGVRQSEILNRYSGIFNDGEDVNIINGNVNEGNDNGNSLFPAIPGGLGGYLSMFNAASSLAGFFNNNGTDLLINTPPVSYNTLMPYDDNASQKFGGFGGDDKRVKLIDPNRNYVYDHNGVDDSDNYRLRLPQWGYADFVNERNIFIKNFTNGFADPGWLYFKIFFKFNTQHGLFGGILNTQSPEKALNGAYKYLEMCKQGVDNNPRYSSARLEDRQYALYKFTSLLSYINSNSPWFFKSIKNLNNASNPYLTDFSKDNKEIELEFAEDAIDMRISTLLSLYKFACFDDINCREIIPENLRKFDMLVVVFSTPLKPMHTPIMGERSNYKKINTQYTTGNDPMAQLEMINKDMMSFKLYNFMNCEIDYTNIGDYMPSNVTNDNPFQLGKNSMKIKYDRVYEYIRNEFTGDLLGSDAFYFIGGNINIIENTNYQNLTLASENYINSNINNILKGNTNFALGNLYGQSKSLYKSYTDHVIDKENTGTKFLTDYVKQKYKLIKGNSNLIESIGYSLLYKLLGNGMRYGTAPGIDGTGTVLNGQGQIGINSAVWQRKMNRLKYGPSEYSNREKRLNAEYTANMFDLKNYINNKAYNSISTASFIN